MKNDEEYFLNQAYEEQEYIRRFEDIMSVAYSLAYNEEMQFRHAVDSDPEGDGYNLYAAENMLSSEDYFKIKVNDRQYKIADLIHEMDSYTQQVLIAWHWFNMNHKQSNIFENKQLDNIMFDDQAMNEDDIPF